MSQPQPPVSEPVAGLCLVELFFPSPTGLAEQALASLSEAVAIFDRSLRLRYANPAAISLYGRCQPAAFCWEIFQKKTTRCARGGEQCWLERVFETGEPFRTVIGQKNGQGKTIQVAVSASPIRGEGDRFEQVVVILRDVTSEVECQRSASFWRSNQAVANLLDSMGEGVVLIGQDYTIIDANRKFQEMTGVTDVRGRLCHQVCHGFDDPCWQVDPGRHNCPVREAFASGKSATAVHCHQHRDGSKRFVEIRALPVRDHEGRVVQVVELLTDITEQRELENRLRQSEKLESLGQLAAGIAHDMNNILTPILGNAELLLASLGKEDPRSAEVRDIRVAAQRAADLVRQLLSFTRRQILSKKRLSLDEVVQEQIALLRRLVPQDIEIQTFLDDGRYLIEADPTQLQQVLLNLAANARDAMPQGGRLVVETDCVTGMDAVCRTCGEKITGDFVRLMVSDTGCGMDEETAGRAFEPFFTTKEQGKGTGMGLATVLGIMHQHHGHVNLYTEPGLGTTFRLYFPVAANQDRSGEPVDKIRLGDRLEQCRGRERILVVDDDQEVRTLLERMLTMFGYQVTACADPLEAEQRFREAKGGFDLLITDVVMPRMGGRELAERVTQLKPDLPVLFTTGYSANAIHHQGELLPGCVFLQKPVLLGDLLETVRSLLDRNHG